MTGKISTRLHKLLKRNSARKKIAGPVRLMRHGYIEKGVEDLKFLSRKHRSSRVRRAAALELLAWKLGKGTVSLPLQEIHAQIVKPTNGFQRKLGKTEYLLLSEAYRREGNSAAAEEVYRAYKGKADRDLLFSLANGTDQHTDKLRYVNSAFERDDLREIGLGGPGETWFDRLGADIPRQQAKRSEPLVSVIMPVYNSADTVCTALRSLLAQTYSNLEILVVDDASQDDTCALVAEIAEQDGRIKLIRSHANRGCYNSRNLGLQAAAGEFVTCHDADDWSHPQKLEIQVLDLIGAPERMANLTQWVRADEDLYFEIRPWVASYVHMNFSSLMFRREPVLERAGYWDTVRFAGDDEFIRRLQYVFGRESVVELPCLLSFGRRGSGSLTRATGSEFSGIMTGSRLYYRWRFERAHASGDAYKAYPASSRSFEIPNGMKPVRNSQPHEVDILFVEDLRLPHGDRILEDIRGLRAGGANVAVTHLPCATRKIEEWPHSSLLELVDKGELQFIPHGEQGRAGVVALWDVRNIKNYNCLLPDIRADHVAVIISDSEMIALIAEQGRHIAVLNESVMRCFGVPVTWYPETDEIRRRFEEWISETGKAVELSERNWPQVMSREIPAGTSQSHSVTA